ncbi:MAG: tetratricopeptide (TPR) repeat protein [Arenicella sp.]|jgi:tetratricopeptide (TPR) repeat protein
MKLSLLKLMSVATLLLASAHIAIAQDRGSLLRELQSGWAVANYQLQDKAQIKAFEALIAKGEANLSSHPKDAEIHVWTGILQSTLAGAKGGLGALSLAKSAKTHLESAIELDGSVLSGSAYTSLGVLYNSVPGWPLGFGDKKKSLKNLKRALEINPAGIDSNYFYADYLVTRKQYTDAKIYFEKALKAAPRAGRDLADAGRREEIELALATIQKRL